VSVTEGNPQGTIRRVLDAVFAYRRLIVWRKIRDLDLDDMIERIRRSTDARSRKACDPIIQAELAFITDKAAALRTLRNAVALAALDRTQSIDDIDVTDPLVEALVRCQNHPNAQPLPTLEVQRGLNGPDASPRLAEIIAAHPELGWNLDEIRDLLVTAIMNRAGDVEVDSQLPPWRISWEPAGAAAYALMMLVTLETLGEL
jgi:hypothetical protein